MEQEYYFQTKWEQWPVHFTHVQSEYVSLSNDLLASENWAFYIKMAVIPNRLKWYFFFFFLIFLCINGNYAIYKKIWLK